MSIKTDCGTLNIHGLLAGVYPKTFTHSYLCSAYWVIHKATQTVIKQCVCDITHWFLRRLFEDQVGLTTIFVKLLKPQYLNYSGNKPRGAAGRMNTLQPPQFGTIAWNHFKLSEWESSFVSGMSKGHTWMRTCTQLIHIPVNAFTTFQWSTGGEAVRCQSTQQCATEGTEEEDCLLVIIHLNNAGFKTQLWKCLMRSNTEHRNTTNKKTGHLADGQTLCVSILYVVLTHILHVLISLWTCSFYLTVWINWQTMMVH